MSQCWSIMRLFCAILFSVRPELYGPLSLVKELSGVFIRVLNLDNSVSGVSIEERQIIVA